MNAKSCFLGCALALCVWTGMARAQLPVALTDKIHRGSGTINILADMAPDAFASYLRNTGELLLAVDLNENVSGIATSSSIAVAIERMELTIRTTDGVFTFGDVWSSTQASLLARNAGAPSEYFTLFGRSGSSQITTGDSALDSYDDVVRIRNVDFTGEILSAEVNVTFLSTADTGRNSNESYFQFSGGFEDFAILNQAQAALLEAANFGVADAPSTVTFKEVAMPSAESTPGTPLPPLLVLLMLAGLLIHRSRHAAKT